MIIFLVLKSCYEKVSYRQVVFYSILQQVEYAGLIERITSEDQDSDEENGVEQLEQDKDVLFSVKYGITSLVDKKTVLQPGDKVCC